MEMHKRIARFFIAAAEKAESAKSNLNIMKLLALLGGSVKVAREPGEPSGDDEPNDFVDAPKSDPGMLDKLMIKVKHSGQVFDKAFKEEISAHVHDMDNYDAAFKRSPAFLLFDELKKKKGAIAAANFFDDATSYVLKDMLKAVKQIHGGTGEKKNREESLFIKFGKGDPNSSVFKEGYKFTGTVESEDATKPFFYQIKMEGAGLAPKTYLVNASEHQLDMDEGEKYKMEVIKEVHDGKDYGVDVKVDGSNVGMNVFPMIEARQAPVVIGRSISNFVREELPKLLGDSEKIEAEKAKLIVIIRRQKKEIAEKEQAGEDVSGIQKVLKTNEEKLRKLMDLGMEGLADPDVLVETDEEKVKPMSETDKTLKYRKKDPHHRWFNVKYVPPKKWLADPSTSRKEKPYSAPGTGEIEQEFSEDDYSKLKDEVLHSLDDKGKVDDAGNIVPPKSLGGVSYEDMLKMMWDSIDAAGNKLKTNPEAWKAIFMKKLEKHVTDKGIDAKKTKLYEMKDKLIADIQNQILTNEKFKSLKDNLVRHIQHKTLKKAADVLTEKITKAWESPSEEKIRDAYTEALLDMEERDKGVGKPVQFIAMVQKPTEEGFRKSLEKSLPEALKLLSVLSGIKPPKEAPGITHAPSVPVVTNEEKAFQHVMKKYSLPEEASKALMDLIKVTQLRRTAPAQTQKQMKDILDKNKITGEAAERVKAVFERVIEMDYQTHDDPTFKAPDHGQGNIIPQYQKLTPEEKDKMVEDKAEDLKKRYPGAKINEILPELSNYATGRIMDEKKEPLERSKEIRKFLKEYPGWLSEDFAKLQKLLGKTKTAFTRANFDGMIDRLKKLFLLEVWHLEDKEMDQKVDLFHQYDEAFPSDAEKNSDLIQVRTKIRDDIKQFIAENPMGVKEEPKTEKTFKQKKVKVEKPTPEVVEKRDSDVLERLRKFRETLKAA